MQDLSLHVLDISQNSLRAGAKNIFIIIRDLPGQDLLEISVEDDGSGMDEELLSRVTDPFVTTRNTRDVGLGIPLLKMAAEMSGGSFSIDSESGKGTRIVASFRHSHIDSPPLGDMSETVVTLIQGNPDIRFSYERHTEQGIFSLDTRELSEYLQGVPLNVPEVLQWIREYLDDKDADS